MNNRTKLFIILAITGWIRVLIVLVPIGITLYLTKFFIFSYEKMKLLNFQSYSVGSLKTKSFSSFFMKNMKVFNFQIGTVFNLKTSSFPRFWIRTAN